jgi:hypothetical protein
MGRCHQREQEGSLVKVLVAVVFGIRRACHDAFGSNQGKIHDHFVR